MGVDFYRKIVLTAFNLELDWLDDYLIDGPDRDAVLDDLPIVASPTSRKSSRASRKKPWLPKFPAISQVLAMGAQVFDNGLNPGRGRAQHVLKLRVYLNDGQRLNQHKPQWYRCVQLIEPKRVLAWAEAENEAGHLAKETLLSYREAAEALAAWKVEDRDAAWAKMGHIASQPGNHYFAGQFVAMRAWSTDEMDMTLHLDGDGTVEIDTFRQNRRSKRAKAPTHYGFYDPKGAISGERGNDER